MKRHFAVLGALVLVLATMFVYMPGAAEAQDTAPPVWEAVYAESPGYTSFQLLLQADEDSRAYYVVLEDGTAAPTAQQVRDGQDGTGAYVGYMRKGYVDLTASTKCKYGVGQLTHSTVYDIYVVAEDSESNLQVSPEKVEVTTLASSDTDPPVWAEGYPKVAGVQATELTLLVDANEGGCKASYVVLEEGAGAPGAEQVRNGLDSTGTPVPGDRRGFVLLTGPGEFSADILGLNPGTGYDIYVVANDSKGNLQTEPVKVTAMAGVISSEAGITAYSFAEQAGPAVIDSSAGTIDIDVHDGTDLTSLVASFELSYGASATVGGTPQESGVTANDFTSPVTYMVTAEDGTTTKEWTVTVTEVTDRDPPEWEDGYPQTEGGYYGAIKLLFKINENGMAYYVVLEDGAIAPTAQQVKEGKDSTGEAVAEGRKGSLTLTANTESSRTVLDLDSGTDYDIYVVAEDNALVPNLTAPVKVDGATATPPDTQAPEWADNYPQVTGITETGFTLLVKTNEDGSAYYVVLEDGASAPTAQQVRDGQDATYTPVAGERKGSITLAAGSEGSVTISGLTPGVSYDIYVVAEDSVPNLQAIPGMVNVTKPGPPLSSEAEVTAYSFAEQTGEAVIDSNAGTIDIEVAHGTDLTNLVADFELSEGATAAAGGTLQESGTTANDFTSPVTYVVTAEDGTTKEWTVTVTAAPAEAPTWPEDSSLWASNVTGNGLDLAWSPAGDNVEVKKYRIYCEGSALETVAGNVYTYSVTGLARGTPYTFKVEAGDGAGNWTTAGPATIAITLPGGNWEKVSAGNRHTEALAGDGTLWGWGQNSVGQVGDGTTLSTSSPVPLNAGDQWDSVVCGKAHNLALKTGGTLWAWGYNNFGQLGIGPGTYPHEQHEPVQVCTDHDWVHIAAGYECSAAVKADGTLWTWGENEYGQLGLGDTADRDTPTQVGTDSDWRSVSLGGGGFGVHALAIKNDGTLWAWGYDGWGQLGNGSASGSHAPIRIGTDSDWIHASAGKDFSLALKSGGTLWGWGHNEFGQLGSDPSENTMFDFPVQINTDHDWATAEAGVDHILAIKKDGTLWAWGNNTCGQLGTLPVESERYTPTQIGTGTNWCGISAGNRDSFAIKADGSLWSWGMNTIGQLGDGTTDNHCLPVEIGAPVPAGSEAEITAYSFAEQTGEAAIDSSAGTIDIEVACGTDLTNLVATFELSEGAIAAVGGAAQESGATANDFSSPVTYVVTAEDGTTTKEWVVTVTAAEFANGSGDGLSAETAFLIATPEHLNNVRNYAGYEHTDKHFKLIADINLDVAPYNTGEGWKPIGSSEEVKPFTGTFDGNGKSISGLFINRPGESNTGLFSIIANRGEIRNLRLVDVDVTAEAHAGGLAGENLNGIITNSSTTGTVTGSSGMVGGLVGWNAGDITGSYSECDVSGHTYVGGLAGRSDGDYEGDISNCYAAGDVEGAGSNVGGLVGYITNGSTISNSYAVGKVSGSESAGGLAGYNAGGTFSANFWDTRTSGTETGVGEGDSTGVTGLPTAGMKQQATFEEAGWDFNSVWGLREAVTYPYLQWQPPLGGDPNEEAVAADKAALTFEVIKGDNTGENNITSGLNLVNSGDHDTTISWSASPAGWIDTGNGAVTRPVQDQGDQAVTLIATISKGNASDTKDFNLTIIAAPDTTPPAWADNYPQVTGVTGAGFTLLVKTSEDGSAYYVVLEGGSKAPGTEQVAAGQDGSGVPVGEGYKGRVGLTAGTESSAEIAGLAPGTAYDIYIVARDMDKNLQSAPEMISVTTAALPASSKAEITAYSFPEQARETIIDASAGTIDIQVPRGTDLTNLVATFELTAGASAVVEGAAQESGITANDFTSPVTYVVTAEDGTTKKEWTVKVTKEEPQVAELTIDTDSLPSGKAGRSYTVGLDASGGTAPYTWSAAGLPEGLKINASTGKISGTPGAAGTFNVNIVVEDSGGRSAGKDFSLAVNRVSNGGSSGSSEPETSIISDVVETGADKLLDEALIDEGKARLSLAGTGRQEAKISAAVISTLAEHDVILTIENTGIRVDYPPGVLDTEQVQSAGKDAVIEIMAREVTGAEREGLVPRTPPGEITGKIFKLAARVKADENDEGGAVITKLAGPVTVTVDLPGPELNGEQISQLTGVRLEVNEDGKVNPVQLGGSYDPETGTFTFRTGSLNNLYTVMLPREQLQVETVITLTVGQKVASRDGKPCTLDAAPYIEAGRTMVPVRFISEELGAAVDWDSATRQVTFTDAGTEIIFTPGSRQVLVNGQAATTDCAPAILPPGRTFIPLRFAGETMGTAVDYNAASREITITR